MVLSARPLPSRYLSCLPDHLLQPLCFVSQVIILIGNKADLEAQRDVTYEEAKQFAEENGESGAEPRGRLGKDFVGFESTFVCSVEADVMCLRSTGLLFLEASAKT